MSTRYAHVVSLIAAIVAAAGATDLGDFFQRIHDEGHVTTYQCYRNGTNLEPPASRNVRVLWRSAGESGNEAQCECTFVPDGGSEEQTIEVSAEYNEQEDYGILSDLAYCCI